MPDDETPTPRESGTWMFYNARCEAFAIRLTAVVPGLRSSNPMRRDLETAGVAIALIEEFDALGRDFKEWKENPRLAAEQRASHIPRFGVMEREATKLLAEISKKWRTTV
jgi:hypothetical protein